MGDLIVYHRRNEIMGQVTLQAVVEKLGAVIVSHGDLTAKLQSNLDNPSTQIQKGEAA